MRPPSERCRDTRAKTGLLLRSLGRRPVSGVTVIAKRADVRGLFGVGSDSGVEPGGGWLGCQDSNLGMDESKSLILPFGYAQSGRHRRSRGLDAERLGGARTAGLNRDARRRLWPPARSEADITQGRSGSTSAPECAGCGGARTALLRLPNSGVVITRNSRSMRLRCSCQSPKPSLRPSDQFTSPPGVATPEIWRPICCSSAGRQGTRLKPSPSSIMANRPLESCVEPTSWPLT